MLHSLHIISSCTVSSHPSKLIPFKHADMFQNIRDSANVQHLPALNTSVIKQTFTEIIIKNTNTLSISCIICATVEFKKKSGPYLFVVNHNVQNNAYMEYAIPLKINRLRCLETSGYYYPLTKRYENLKTRKYVSNSI
jgi:hypothetical protein